MNQIANMGNVYSQALLTIIAASGSNANAGLPGVRVGSRKSAQKLEHVGGMILANEFGHPKDVIDQSYWNTRGWTYQEKELCKRFLVFSQTHVSFQCNRTVFKEDSGLRDIAIVGGRALRIREERQPVWNSYRRAVVEYTKRNLTNASDMINTFLAFASLLRPGFKGDFLFGLPETELDFALLWQPKSCIRRRIDPENGNSLFPSWSWAGWIGEVEYKWNKHQLDDSSRVDWQCWDNNGGNLCFRTSEELRAPRCGDYGDWKYVPNSRGTPYYYQPQNPDIWCLHPTAPKDSRAGYVLIQPGSHHLTFRAYTAFFGIKSTTRTLPINNLGEDRYIIQKLGIFDHDGWLAGTIHDRWHRETLQSKKHEFMCLSRRRYNQMDDGPVPQSIEEDFKGTPSRVTLYPFEKDTGALLDDFDYRRYNQHRPWPLYNVMMIGWEKGVGFRVAIGVIHVSAFWQARPTRKVITLA